MYIDTNMAKVIFFGNVAKVVVAKIIVPESGSYKHFHASARGQTSRWYHPPLKTLMIENTHHP
jgi:hypothetical protein